MNAHRSIYWLCNIYFSDDLTNGRNIGLMTRYFDGVGLTGLGCTYRPFKKKVAVRITIAKSVL